MIPSNWSQDETERLVTRPTDQTAESAAQTLTPLRYDALLTNVQIQAAFFLSEGATASLSARVSEVGAYQAQLTASGDVRLWRGTELLQETALSLPSQVSHTLTLTVFEGTLTVLVDDQTVLTAVDAAPLPAGAVDIGGVGVSGVPFALDDVFIWLPASDITPTQPAPIVIESPVEPTEPPLETPTQISDNTLPAIADGEVSAQGDPISLDTPTNSSLSLGQSQTWDYVLPSANLSYYIKVVRTSGTLRLNIEANGGGTTAFMSDNGYAFLWMSSPTSGTKSFTIAAQGTGSATQYTVRVYPCCEPIVPLNGSVSAGPVIGTVQTGQDISYWAYNLATATAHYLKWHRSEGNLLQKYTVRRRSDSQIVAQGDVLIGENFTAIYIPSTAAGWYDIELEVLPAPESGLSTQGSYDLGLFYGSPFPPVPTNFSQTDSDSTSVTFTFGDDPTDKTEFFYLMRAPSISGPFEIVNFGNANTTLLRDLTLECGTGYVFKLRAVNWASPSTPTNADSQTISINTWACPPANDVRYSPVNITSFPQNLVVSDLRSANDIQGDPQMSCIPSGYNSSLWYRVQSPVSHMLEITTLDTTYDTVLAVYRADAGEGLNAALTELACHDDIDIDNGIKTSEIILTTQPNKIYYIVVGAWGSQRPILSDEAHIHIDSLKAPIAPTLLTPINNGATKFTLEWNPVDTAVEYHVQVSTTATFAARLTDEYIGGTYTMIDNLPDAKYYWRVRAVGSRGLTGNWSPTWTFNKDNVVPGVPNITAPAANGAVAALRPSFVVSPVPGATRYEWEVATSAAFGVGTKKVITPSITGTTTLTLTQSLPQGQYYAHVRALDAAGNKSAYTAARPFQIDLRQTPANGSQVVVVNAATAMIFKWGLPQGVSTYTLEVSSTENFSNIVYSKPLTAPAITTTIPNVGSVLTSGAYYWRLVLNGDGMADTSAISRRFVVTPPVAPAPKFDAQPNGGILNTLTPTFSWGAVSYASPVTYEIQVDNLSTFVSPEYSAQSINALTKTTTTLADGIYYARVRAVNTYGGAGAWSLIIRVILDTTPPGISLITAPYTNAWSSNARQPVAWKAVPGAARYFIQYSVLGDFSDSPLPVDDNIAAVAAPNYTPKVSLAQRDYTIRVWAKDAAGNEGPFSDPVTYTYTVNASPVNDGTVTTPRPVFRWTAVPGAKGYQIVVAQDPTCTSNIMHTSPVLNSLVTGYSYPVTSASALALQYDNYYWCVAVNRGPLSGDTFELPLTGFRVNISPMIPPTLTITQPDGLWPVPSSIVDVWWKDLPAALLSGPYTYTYQIQIDNNPQFNIPEFDQVTDGLNGSYIETTTLDDGRYYVRARAINNYDAAGSWSAVRTFLIDTTPPDVPTLVTPAQDSTVTSLAPTISWTSVPGASAYYVQISHKSDFSISYDWQVTTASTSVPFALLNQSYYVHVQSVDAADNRSAYSPARVFNVQWPTMQAPIAMLYATSTPTLSWEEVSWATLYDVQISATSTFTKILASSTTGGTIFNVPSRVDGVYYWRVRAKNATTGSGWSDVITIAVDAP